MPFFSAIGTGTDIEDIPLVLTVANSDAPSGRVLTQADGITVTDYGAGSSVTVAVDSTVLRTNTNQTVYATHTVASGYGLQFQNGSGYTVNLQPHTSMAANYNFILPAHMGTNGYYLRTDGTNSYWATLATDYSPCVILAPDSLDRNRIVVEDNYYGLRIWHKGTDLAAYPLLIDKEDEAPAFSVDKNGKLEFPSNSSAERGYLEAKGGNDHVNNYGGKGGYIRMNGGNAFFDISMDGYDGGYIDLSAGLTSPEDSLVGGAPGYINCSGKDADIAFAYSGGNGGYINLKGGQTDFAGSYLGDAGYIDCSAGTGVNGQGGSIKTYGGSNSKGGDIHTYAFGGNAGGNISTFGQVAAGGNIQTNGGLGSGATGGWIRTQGGSSASARGGRIDTFGTTVAGGDINTSAGGGSITTNGASGSIGLGVSATRTTLNGSGSAVTVTLPAITGTLASLAGTQTFTGSKTFSSMVSTTVGTNTTHIQMQSAGGSAIWCLSMGNETIPNLYIGGGPSSYSSYYFWRGDWNTAGRATNTFRIADPSSTSKLTLAVEAISGQTGNLQEWRDSSSTDLAKIDISGNLWLNTVGSSTASPRVIEFYNMNSGTGRAMRLNWDGGYSGMQAGADKRFQMFSYWGIELCGSRQNGTPNSFNYVTGTASDVGVLVLSPATTRKPFAVQAVASQSANLTEWQNSSGTALASVDASGNFSAASIAGSTSWNAGTIPINKGGTGQTTANAALNALLPSQATHSGKFLTTDGTKTSWATISGGGTSSGAAGYVQYADGSGGFSAEGDFTWDNSNNILNLGGGTVGRIHFNNSATSTVLRFNAGNVMLGDAVGNTTLSGGYNTIVGVLSGRNLSTGTNNVCLGYAAGDGITTGSDNFCFGYSVLNGGTGASNNTGIGYLALTSCTGNNNIGIGYSAGSSVSTGEDNIFLGYSANGTTGSVNYQIAIGRSSSVNGTGAIAIGYSSSAAANYSVAIGYAASAAYSKSVAIGNNALPYAANIVALGSSGVDALGLQLGEMSSTPGTPATGTAVLYLVDNGSGKQSLRIKWDDGVVTTLATQP